MHLVARKMLLTLFQRWQKHPYSSRTITLSVETQAPEYHTHSSFEDRELIWNSLLDAKKQGAIQLIWGKGAAATDLLSIRLVDGNLLAVYLGVIPAADQLNALLASLTPELAGCSPWISELLTTAAEKWQRGQQALGLSVEDAYEIRQIFLALHHVSQNHHEGLDMRTFSAKYLGGSKVMESIDSRFARLWAQQFNLAGLEVGEVLRSIGLEKFPHPIYLKGPLSIHTANGNIVDVETMLPWFGLHPKTPSDVTFKSTPDYVLTIENLTSFNRHVTEITDRALVIYTGGFPSPAVRRLLNMIDSALPKETLCFHWGDIDIGGIRIFQSVEACFKHHCLRPHLMDSIALKKMAGDVDSTFYGKAIKDSERELLDTMAKGDGYMSELANAILTDSRKVEQELFDPEPPPRKLHIQDNRP